MLDRHARGDIARALVAESGEAMARKFHVGSRPLQGTEDVIVRVFFNDSDGGLKMNRHVAVLLGLCASLACSAIGDTCQAAPITIVGDYNLGMTSGITFPLPIGGQVVDGSPVPLGSYDFGNGPIGVGTANVISARLSTVVLPTIGSSATVRVIQLADQFRTTEAVPFSSLNASVPGMGIVYGNLNPNFLSTASVTITRTSDTGGTYTETLTEVVDDRADGPGGPLLYTSPPLTFTGVGTWQTTPPAGALVIPGVNDANFFVVSAVFTSPTAGSSTLTSVPSVPEPSSGVLAAEMAGLVGIGLAAVRLRHRIARIRCRKRTA